ncbi:MAG: FAD-binding protein [Verrucomicrobiaceae bacterium]|nr:FAD-binding protein [Verrucomicrobiaceae bacterium]
MNPTSQHELIQHLADKVKTCSRIAVTGNGTKPGMVESTTGATVLQLNDLAGIIEYEPSEYTITVLAGTKLSDLIRQLDSCGQYLPFDPLLVDAGATVGGTIGANASGPGRFRYGGVRDFIIGVQFIDGRGRVVRGGGQVVKNAAGFDFPKLLVGSAGRLGVITEVTFKVFPNPEASLTASTNTTSLLEARKLVSQLRVKPYDLDAIEVDPDSRVIIRLAGHAEALSSRLSRIRQEVPGFDQWDSEQAVLFWQKLNHPAPDPSLHRIRMPVNAETLPLLPKIPIHFSSAMSVASFRIPSGSSLDLPHTNFDGVSVWPKSAFLDRLKAALDPENKFGSLF